MPQSSKDNNGGKTHANKKTHASGEVSGKAASKVSDRSKSSPIGSMKHGEKKTTPH